MAGNARGRIKERMEGMHRNLDWVVEHTTQILSLIGDKNPGLSKGVEAVGKAAKQLDDIVQGLYGSI